MKRHFDILLTVFIMLTSIRFFEPVFVSKSALNYLQYIGVIVALAFSIPYLFKGPSRFILPVYILLFSILFSILMASLYWDQSILDSILATFEYFIVLFFFYLKSSTLSIKSFERIILGFGITYLLLYAFQFANAPVIYFGKSLYGDEYTFNRGIVRIIFPAGGILYLTTFLAFSKSAATTGLRRWFWISLSIVCAIVPILQVTRQFIASVLLILMIHLFFLINLSMIKKSLITLAFFISGILLLNSDLPILEELKSTTNNDIGQGVNYIRVEAGKYFLFDLSPNSITSIFGNGVAYSGVSDYGHYMDMLEYYQEFHLSDVGIIAVYSMFGIFSIIAFVIIWILSFTVPLPREYYYLKYYLWLLLFTSLTWYSVYHYHYLIFTITALAMYQKASEPIKLLRHG